MNELSKLGGRRPGAGRPGGPSEVFRLPLPLVAVAKRMKDWSLRASDINAFLDVSARTVASGPLATTSAACGFPSPAGGYIDQPFDFYKPLEKNTAVTYAMRISGESMRDKGFYPAFNQALHSVGTYENIFSHSSTVLDRAAWIPADTDLLSQRLIRQACRPGRGIYGASNHLIRLGRTSRS